MPWQPNSLKMGESEQNMKMPIIKKSSTNGRIATYVAGLIVVTISDSSYSIGVLPTRDPSTGKTHPFCFRTVSDTIKPSDMVYELTCVDGRVEHTLTIGTKRAITVTADDNAMACVYKSYTGTKVLVSSEILTKENGDSMVVVSCDDRTYKMTKDDFEEIFFEDKNA